MKGNSMLQLHAFIPWQSCDLNLALKMHSSYRQEEPNKIDDDSKNKGVIWLCYTCFLVLTGWIWLPCFIQGRTLGKVTMELGCTRSLHIISWALWSHWRSVLKNACHDNRKTWGRIHQQDWKEVSYMLTDTVIEALIYVV